MPPVGKNAPRGSLPWISRAGLAGVAALVCLLLASRALAQSAVAAGQEIQANTHTEGIQRLPAVAAADDGSFVVVWESYGQDGDVAATFARRFGADGSPLTGELQVNTYTESFQYQSTIAMDGDGDFVVAWQSFGQDGDSNGVFVRRFDSAGEAQGAEMQVNAFTAGDQHFPAAAMAAGGSFVVVWSSFAQDTSSDGVFARLFDAAGTPQSEELQVNSFTVQTQHHAAVAMDDDGDFVVAWQSTGQDGDDYGVFARRFDSGGAAQGAELQVNTYSVSAQTRAAAAMDADGDFVIAWQSFFQDGGAHGIFARRFDSSGGALGAELQISSHTTRDDRAAAVAIASAGDFLVTWARFSGDGDSDGVFARLFTASGSPRGDDFQVNTFTPSTQHFPAAAADGAGGFVVAWQSFGQDGQDYGIFAQRLTTLATLDVDADGVVAALTDGLLVVRFLFGFSGAALTGNAVGEDCTRCGAGAIASYLEGLGATLDVDDNGSDPGALTDGLLFLRFAFGFTGGALINGTVEADCDRCTADEIETYLEGLV